MSVSPTFLDQVFTRKICNFAGNTLIFYDYLLTLSLEVVYIWNAPWTLVKALFLINRYGNLIGQTFVTLGEIGYLGHGSQFCTAFQVYSSCFAVFSGESIRLLVVMRACAISRCKRSIAILLETLYVLYAIAMFVAITKSVNHADPQFENLSEISVCFSPVPTNSWTFWFILFFVDAFILVIVGYNLYRLAGGLRGPHPTRLIHLIARDTMLFYFATLFNVLFSIVCWSVYAQDPRNTIQRTITCPVLSIVGQRLVLNLRRFRTQPDSTYSISVVVDREIAAMHDDPSNRESEHRVGIELRRDRTSGEVIPMIGIRSDHVPGQGNQGTSEESTLQE